jgi:hypothetical protein
MNGTFSAEYEIDQLSTPPPVPGPVACGVETKMLLFRKVVSFPKNDAESAWIPRPSSPAEAAHEAAEAVVVDEVGVEHAGQDQRREAERRGEAAADDAGALVAPLEPHVAGLNALAVGGPVVVARGRVHLVEAQVHVHRELRREPRVRLPRDRRHEVVLRHAVGLPRVLELRLPGHRDPGAVHVARGVPQVAEEREGARVRLLAAALREGLRREQRDDGGDDDREEDAGIHRSPPSVADAVFLGTRGAYSRTAAAIVFGSVFRAKRLKMRPPGPTRYMSVEWRTE